MPAIPNVKLVQREIQYSNDTEFIIFDIKVTNSEGWFKYLPHTIVYSAGVSNNIPVVPILFKGTLDECLEWSQQHNADPSEVWKIFNMPHEIEDNIREGHVIKPLDTIIKGSHRIIFKDKNTKFKESKDKSNKNSVPKLQYSDAMIELLNDMDSMICVNRFNSVISKYGDYTIKDFQTLMNLMVEDMYNEVNRTPELVDKIMFISNEEKAELRKVCIRKVSQFMGINKKELF